MVPEVGPGLDVEVLPVAGMGTDDGVAAAHERALCHSGLAAILGGSKSLGFLVRGEEAREVLMPEAALSSREGVHRSATADDVGRLASEWGIARKADTDDMISVCPGEEIADADLKS